MPQTAAGQRNVRVQFQRCSATRGALGQPGQKAWADLGSPRLAKVLYGSGSERRAGAVEGAVQTATFRVLADTVTGTVIATDRIVADGLDWDITGTAPMMGPQAREIEFTAVASRG